ncbi:MAG: CinA family nicotinamide mononucleotide deamidase-related protein [Thermomicrobium sp.]|nr:CinA family nicotinamide mononucleotide deamidase-related protein [Thermomicrobium sp.]
MEAVVISIGTELVDGHLTDTNATFLAQELNALGIPVSWSAQVGDDLPSIVRILRRAWEDAQLIVTTGGIGPTDDDVTREAIAALLDEPLSIDPELVEHIRAFFAARGLTMPERNVKQAFRIPSCEPLPNPIGTAPGWFVRRDGRFIAVMPGVPREMMRMWREHVVPRLLAARGGGAILFRTVKTIGLGESLVEERLHDLIQRGSPRIATYAKDDGVHVRITARSSDAETARRHLDEAEREIRLRLGVHVYGTDATTLGSALLLPLTELGWTIAVTEQGSGGRLSELVAEEPLAASCLVSATVLPASVGPDLPVLAHARELAHTARARTAAACGYAVVLRVIRGETPDRSRGEAALVLVTPVSTAERAYELVSHPQELRRRVMLWAAEFLRLALWEAVERVRGSTATFA